METTVDKFFDVASCADYIVDGDQMTRQELEEALRRAVERGDLSPGDDVYVDVRHDGKLIAVIGADSHSTANIWVVETAQKTPGTVDTLPEKNIRSHDDGSTTAVTTGGKKIIISPEWNVWSDSAGGFDGWYGVNVCLDGNEYTYCPDWAGDDGCELRIVDFIDCGVFAVCMRRDYVPGEYKDVDEFLCSGWPWTAIRGWLEAALTEALEYAEQQYKAEAAEIIAQGEDDEEEWVDDGW